MSKSTSINELPKNENSPDDIQESMMVNSILKEIENEEELNDENEDSLKYSMDTSQIPPKINNEMPTKEIIENATREIFNEVNNEDYTEESQNKKEIDDFLKEPNDDSEKIELDTDEKKDNQNNSLLPNIDAITNNIRNRVIPPVVILILFVLLTLPRVDKIIIKFLPKMASVSGGVNTIGNILKGLVISVIVLIISFFL